MNEDILFYSIDGCFLPNLAQASAEADLVIVSQFPATHPFTPTPSSQ